eukprot:ANDGO_02196.mRNA.1 hypothetical protein
MSFTSTTPCIAKLCEALLENEHAQKFPGRRNAKINVIGAVSADLGAILFESFSMTELKKFHKESASTDQGQLEKENDSPSQEDTTDRNIRSRPVEESRGTTGQLFASCIRKLAEHLVRIGESTDRVLVFDNYRTHSGKFVGPALTGTGIQIHCLPPWSPFLNPIENVIGHVKKAIRAVWAQQTVDLEKLAYRSTKPSESITDARVRVLRAPLSAGVNTISKDIIRSYCEKSRSYTPELIEKTPISNWD